MNNLEFKLREQYLATLVLVPACYQYPGGQLISIVVAQLSKQAGYWLHKRLFSSLRPIIMYHKSQ